MSGTVPIPYYSNRGSIYYTPLNPILDKLQSVRLPSPPCRPRQRRPHSIHITRLPAGFIPFDLRPQPSPEPKKDSRFRLELRKLASRENAKKVLGVVLPNSFFSTTTSNPTTASASPASTSAASSTRSTSPETIPSTRTSFSAASADPTTILSRRAAALRSLDGLEPAMPTPSIADSRASGRDDVNNAPMIPARSGAEMEKPICSGNGVACYIQLAEPVIYLAGLDHDGTSRDSPSNHSAMVRGKLIMKVAKSAKIKAVTLIFTGKARTEWPEGIPPEKTVYFQEESLRNEHLPFFDAKFTGSDVGYGAQCNYTFKDNKSASSSVVNLSIAPSEASFTTAQSKFSFANSAARSNRSSMLSTKEQKRLSLQSNQSRSFHKDESPFGPTPQQKGYKTFHPGTYEYSFELPIHNNSPETIKLGMASVKWELEAIVQRAGTFKPDLQGKQEITVVRSPSEDSLELVEPISISRRWDDQLQYEIMISGKSFPLGSKIPIAFKLTPLAKVQVHKIKVFVSETIEYFTSNKKVTRKENGRKLLLFEKTAGKPLAKEFAGSEVNILEGGERPAEERARRRELVTAARARAARMNNEEPVPLPEPSANILGDIELGDESYFVQTELEMNVQLPTCEMMAKDRLKELHPDCTWKCAQVHHWIKIIMRISRVDADDPTGKKRRHFEISIDSPFTVLNCRATQANLALPEYVPGPNASHQEQQHTCGCPNATPKNPSPRSSVILPEQSLDNMAAGDTNPVPGLARPPQAHLSNPTAAVQRPIHLLRQPSFNPPEWSADDPPPPMPTPPPGYESMFTPSQDPMADYFARFHSEYDDEGDDDRAFSRGRVNVPHPRTPGGRTARSMDIQREFMMPPGDPNAVAASHLSQN